MKPLLELVEFGEIDPSFVITHSVGLEEAPEAYKTFKQQNDGCIKVVLKPGLQGAAANGNGTVH
jgi:threonine dehydrogenase-like Zn-dependent dehydrogenase